MVVLSTESIAEQIDSLVNQIAEAVHPVRIVLFGSLARGDMQPGSDIDLLVVMPEDSHRRKTARLLYRTIQGITVPYDIVVAKESDLDRHRDNPGLIYRTILEEGKTLYAT
ncbi:nucleotidyltransferase domain-containing protein [bacterium]|nr:nucleotidyltransferase domain-containing protein [bacterium]